MVFAFSFVVQCCGTDGGDLFVTTPERHERIFTITKNKRAVNVVRSFCTIHLFGGGTEVM